MARELGKKVMVEGVESGDDATSLRTMGCEFAAGIYFGGAHSEGDVVQLLKSIRRTERKLQPRSLFKGKAKAAELKTANAIMELTPAHFGNWLPMGDGFWVGGAVPFDIQIFLASGDWFVEIGGGTRLVVWAGVLRKDLQTSVIRVWREGKAQGFIKEVQLGSHGMAAVVGAEKRILQIRCADGTEFRFDAETLELVK